MTFDFSIALARFQRAVRILLWALNWKVFLDYIEDIIVNSKSEEIDIRHEDEVLSIRGKSGLSLSSRRETSLVEVWTTSATVKHSGGSK